MAAFGSTVVIGRSEGTKLVLGREVLEAGLVDFISHLLELSLAVEGKLTVIKLLVVFGHYKVL